MVTKRLCFLHFKHFDECASVRYFAVSEYVLSVHFFPVFDRSLGHQEVKQKFFEAKLIEAVFLSFLLQQRIPLSAVLLPSRQLLKPTVL